MVTLSVESNQNVELKNKENVVSKMSQNFAKSWCRDVDATDLFAHAPWPDPRDHDELPEAVVKQEERPGGDTGAQCGARSVKISRTVGAEHADCGVTPNC